MRVWVLLLTALQIAHALKVLDFDKVQGFDQAVPHGQIGNMIFSYQPLLEVRSGCVPYPALDRYGNVG